MRDSVEASRTAGMNNGRRDCDIKKHALNYQSKEKFMKKSRLCLSVRRGFSVVRAAVFVVAFLMCAAPAFAQTARTKIDVQSYRIEAALDPAQRFLRAAADVTFTPLEATRTVVFELNGSLKVDFVERNGRRLTNVVQDAVGVSDLGPNVRVDLGDFVAANTPVTLTFRWTGALFTPEGGPLPTKRLAAITPDVSYLMYAARWFPFNDYAADKATADITVAVPTGYEVAGSSDQAVTRRAEGATTRFRFVHTTPALIGNLAAARYATRNLRVGNYEVQFYTRAGAEKNVERYGELVGRLLNFYTQRFGNPAFGKRFVVAQTDDETLDAYTAPGMLMLSTKLMTSGRDVSEERLQREVAYQWWGQTVGLRSFDDAWLSQGLGEFSAYLYRENNLTGGTLDGMRREQLERALLFESNASIARAPSTLDDQSSAYQAIVYNKGSLVFTTLRQTLGEEKFGQLLRTYLERFRGKNASIIDFEKLTTEVAGTNMRYFFARYVESTGVPEFSTDYQIIRTREGKFRTRGTLKQNLEDLRLPVELRLNAEGDDKDTTIRIEDKSEDFDFETEGQPIAVTIDPEYKILRTSEELKITTVARRGIELYREGQYAEALRQLEEALKLNKSSSWIYYHIGLIYLEQRNYQQARDNFDAAIAGDLNPSWIEAWANIKKGNAYDAEGNRTRAVDAYQKAVNTGVNYDNAQAAARAFINTPFNPRAEQQAQSGAQ